MANKPEALFARDGDRVSPSRLTGGPWSPDAQHGGAPASLLAGEIQRTPADGDMALVRMTVELLRPVPIAPLRLQCSVIRPGKRVQVIEASLHHGETPVARAVGVRIRRGEFRLPPMDSFEQTPPPPEQVRPARMFARAGSFANDAVEIRAVKGDFSEAGPGQAWFRLRTSVLEGIDPTPVETACAAADFGNGLSNWDPDRNWLFINPDLTVYFARPPEGRWIFLDAATMLHATGTGMAESRMSDRSGRFGRSVQSLLVEPNQESR